MAHTRKSILARLRRNDNRLRAFGVRRLGLFGSFVRDEQGPNSDLDFLVEFEPGAKTFDNFMGLSLFLEDLFERRVELLTPESLSPHIGPHIRKEAVYVTFAA